MRQRLRTHRVDVLLCLLAVVQQLELWLTDRPHATLPVVVLTASTLTLLARRRLPATSLVLFFAAQAAVVGLMPQGIGSSFFGFLAGAAVAGAAPGWAAVLGWAAATAVLAQQSWFDPYGSGLSDFALSMAVMTAFWAAGMLVARRTRTVRELADKLVETEREAIAAERARITREMHDVVAHGLTVVIVQSVAAQEAVEHGASAQDLLIRLRAAEDSARGSLADLRRLLTILRMNPDPEITVPARGLAGIEELVRGVRGTADVNLTVDGEPRSLWPGLDLAVYRIVQESLTNAVKHAPGAPVRVTLGYHPDEVTITVSDEGPGTTPSETPGHGLIGMRERVALFGGHLTAGPRSQGGFTVRVDLPVTADTS
jgi:signal transduction histidine kinase